MASLVHYQTLVLFRCSEQIEQGLDLGFDRKPRI
jgi:hypothetical protein